MPNGPGSRSSEIGRSAGDADGRTLAELEAMLGGPKARATLAWMLKYDLLRATYRI